MTKPRSPKQAMRAVHDATELVVQQGGVIHEDAMWDASEAALDGASRDYLAKIISGKSEQPYVPKGGWRAR